jgi:hypothetical protein
MKSAVMGFSEINVDNETAFVHDAIFFCCGNAGADMFVAFRAEPSLKAGLDFWF